MQLNKVLILLCLIFLTVGSMFTMNDILLPTVMEYYNMSYTQATLIQVAFYITYIVFPIPIARMIERYGYKTSIIVALLTSATGCLLFIPSQLTDSYAVILLSIFTLSTGITIINVAANPFIAVIGPSEGAHIRINFVQSFSRLGYALTPIIAAPLIYSNSNERIDYYLPYALIGITILLITYILYMSPITAGNQTDNQDFSVSSMFAESKKYPHLQFGIIAMFFYVGAEASTAGFFIPYLMNELAIPTTQAIQYLSLYYIFAAVMGIIASVWLLKFIAPHKLVAIGSIYMIGIYLVCICIPTAYNHYLLASLGLGLSIMFPTLFSLAIENTGAFAAKASALLNFAIVGGAVFTPIQGYLADQHGVAFSYIVPCICFVVITFYALFFTYRKESRPDLEPIDII